MQTTTPYKYLQLSLVAFMLVLASCSDEKAIELPSQTQTSKPKAANQAPEAKQSKTPVFAVKSSLFSQQWFLYNDGSGVHNVAGDLNVKPVWEMGIRGQGITVGIIDDYVDDQHPSLKERVVSQKHYFSEVNPCTQDHGTPVAGIVGASNLEDGPVGVAPEVSIEAQNVFHPTLKDRRMPPVAELVKALSRNAPNIAVYNNSWTYSASGNYNSESIELHKGVDEGIRTGFNGKGSVYVFSSGNAPFFSLASNVQLAHPGIIAVSGITKIGEPQIFGSKRGWQHWVSAFTLDILTTDNVDRDGKCGYDVGSTTKFSGTSAAAPMVAGVVALMRQANPELTYRDVKLILAETARRKTLPYFTDWTTTGKKKSIASESYHYSPWIGFGIVDAHAAVKLAKTWKNLPVQKHDHFPYERACISLEKDKSFEFSIPVKNSAVKFVESIQLSMELLSSKTINTLLGMELTDPKGHTRKLITDQLAFGELKKGVNPFKTNYNAFLGASTPNGTWVLKIKAPKDTDLAIRNLAVNIYGH